MYGFIFMMYAVVACVLFWLMANRWVSSPVLSGLTSHLRLLITFYHRRERRKTRQEQARQQEQFDQEVEAVDAAVDSLAESEDKTEKSKGDCDTEDGDVKETTFESPSPEEIQQLTAEPKKPIEKKLE